MLPEGFSYWGAVLSLKHTQSHKQRSTSNLRHLLHCCHTHSALSHTSHTALTHICTPLHTHTHTHTHSHTHTHAHTSQYHSIKHLSTDLEVSERPPPPQTNRSPASSLS